MDKEKYMVTYFKILNDIFGREVAEWLPDGRLKRWVTSQAPIEGVISYADKRIKDEELAEIINACVPKGNLGFTLAYGEPDFLQFGFLGRGLRCGSAVCRLVRDFSKAEPDDMEKILQVIKEREYTIPDLKNLISLQENIWGQYKTVTDALENPQIQNQVKEELRKKKIPVATGFLVGRRHLLTNYHVLYEQKIIQQFIAQFHYELDYLGNDVKQIEYELDENFYIANDELDYAIIKLKSKNQDEIKEDDLIFSEAGDNFGWLPMVEDHKVITPHLTKQKRNSLLKEADSNQLELDQNVRKRLRISDLSGGPVFIIQHPQGRRKEIVLFNNEVQEIYTNYFQYKADADLGSSGSPVFNLKWQLIGLHHAALVRANSKTEQPDVVGQLGIRMSQIVKDLQNQANPNQKEDVKNFLKEKNLPYRGRIFITHSPAEENKDLEDLKNDPLLEQRYELFKQRYEDRSQVIRELSNQVRDALKSLNVDKYKFEVPPVPDELSSDETFKWLNDQEYRAGDVALEIDIQSRPKQPEDRGASVFYIAGYTERKIHAEIMLFSLLKECPALPSRGVKPDTATEQGRLDFCREVKMPSLRITVGFLTNDDDWRLIKESSEELANGIAKGLIAWANILSPVVYIE